MTIKGKGKTKPKQAARAPRRAPVPVKKPFFQRGWVKAVAAFLAGVLVLSLVWWTWEGLDKNRNSSEAADKLGQQRVALTEWKANLEPTLSSLGQIQGSAFPQIATSIAPALDALGKGTDPGVTAADMTKLSGQLDDAAKSLEKFKLADHIRDQGFDASQADVILGGQADIIAGLRSLGVAARLVAVALETPGQQEALVAAARQAHDTGQDLIARGWTRYSNASSAAGMPLPVNQGLGAGS